MHLLYVSVIQQGSKGPFTFIRLMVMQHAFVYIRTMTVELTTEFTLIIRLGEPLIRDGKSNTESKAGAKWFTCMCSSYPSFENFWGSGCKIDNENHVLNETKMINIFNFNS